eukprot:m.10390 g.10390  ORF g.10390 m.10390 type:complete len:84 (-) comp4314_c0_seq2:173-424(-)
MVLTLTDPHIGLDLTAAINNPNARVIKARLDPKNKLRCLVPSGRRNTKRSPKTRSWSQHDAPVCKVGEGLSLPLMLMEATSAV